MNKTHIIANQIKCSIEDGRTTDGILTMFCIQGNKEVARTEIIDKLKEEDPYYDEDFEIRFIAPSEIIAFRDNNTRPTSVSGKGCLFIDDVEGLFQEFPERCAETLSTLARTMTCQSTGWHLVLLLGDLDDGIWVPKLRYLLNKEVIRSYKIQ